MSRDSNDAQADFKGERLIRALSHVERVPLLPFLAQPRSEFDVRREFPAVPATALRRALVFLEDSLWIQESDSNTTGHCAWMLRQGAIRVAMSWTHDLIPSARPTAHVSSEGLRFEVVALRRGSAREVLRAAQSGIVSHDQLVKVTGLQSGTVSDVTARLEMGGLLTDSSVVFCPQLNLLRLFADLLGLQSETSGPVFSKHCTAPRRKRS